MISADDPTFIDITKLKRMQLLHVHFLLFDIRDLDSYNKGHIKGALHIEGSCLIEKLSKMVPSKDMPIVLYDVDGKSCINLVREAEKMGYINIVILEGGYQSYSGIL